MQNKPLQANIPLPARQKKLVCAACIAMYFTYQFVSYACNVSLTRFLEELNALGFYSAIAAAHTIGMMISAPIAGRLSDSIGRKWLAVYALSGFLIFMALASTAQHAVLYLLMRAVCSVCSGFFIGVLFTIVSDVTEPNERAPYFGMLAAAAATGMLIGPFIGGFLTDRGLYRFSHLIGIPSGLFAIFVLAKFYPNRRRRGGLRLKFDWKGLLLLILSACSIVFYLNFAGKAFGRFSFQGIAMFVFGILCAVALVFVEIRTENPVLDMRLFKIREFRIASSCHMLYAVYIGFAASYIPLYAQKVLNISATVTSTLSMPQTLTSIIASSLIGVVIRRNPRNFKPAYIACGACGAIALLVWGTLLPITGNLALIYVFMIAGGFGYALDQIISSAYMQTTMPTEKLGFAQGFMVFCASLGMTLANAVAGTIVNIGDRLDVSIPIVFCIGAAALSIIFFQGLFAVKRE